MTCEAEVAALVRGYYAMLERGEPLSAFYARDEDAGPLGPVVKIGSGKGEEFTGYTTVERAVNDVSDTFTRNCLESRALHVRCWGDAAWFSDLVWWSGAAYGAPFASLTRWTGVCLRLPAGWKFVQVHVSEGV